MVLTTIGIFTLLLMLSLVAEPLARWIRLPHSSLMVILGALAGYGLTLGLGIDTGLRATNFHDLVFFILLPVLIFDAAFNLEFKALKSNLLSIMVLAVAGMLLTTVITGVLLYFGIGHPTGFPWIAALLAGALLAATDPVAVVAQMKSLGAPEKLSTLLEGESLFNDATAIVTFSIFLSLALMPTAEVTASGAFIEFTKVFLGGVIVGAVFGVITSWLYHRARSDVNTTIITLATAYASFLIAEAALHVSGVMATLVAALMLSRGKGEDKGTDEKVEYFWQSVTYLANGSVFLLMGFTITVTMFTERYLAMVIAIGAVIVARFVSTFGSLFVVNWFLKEKISVAYQRVLYWGGLRGVVSIALALSLPVDLPYWYTIQSMAFGVVLFTMFVQAPTMPWLLEKNGLTSTKDAAQSHRTPAESP